ncbi:MAG: 50S ribosomal protein L22 [Patescibacteria group bacterium]
MQVTAHLKSIRIAPRKVRSVTHILKGLDAVAAKHQLRYLTRRSSHPIEKLIDSALANANNNLGLVRENMRIKDIIVGGGPVLKRFEPKGFGSVSPVAKRTSHVTIILEEKVPGLKSEKKEVKKEEVRTEHKHDSERKSASAADYRELGPKESAVKKFTRKIFQRKSI